MVQVSNTPRAIQSLCFIDGRYLDLPVEVNFSFSAYTLRTLVGTAALSNVNCVENCTSMCNLYWHDNNNIGRFGLTPDPGSALIISNQVHLI